MYQVFSWIIVKFEGFTFLINKIQFNKVFRNEIIYVYFTTRFYFGKSCMIDIHGARIRKSSFVRIFLIRSCILDPSL